MEHMHLVVNLANEKGGANSQPSVVPNTDIMIKINKALLISKRATLFYKEEYYKYAIELKVNGDYWVIFRRYSEIRDEHERMCKKSAALRKETFPPRGLFTSTDTFQMDRQQKLEQYLRTYIELALGDNIYDYSSSLKKAGSSDARREMTREHFTQTLAFFQETTEDKLNVQKLGWKYSDTF